jgi:hypothetical protein
MPNLEERSELPNFTSKQIPNIRQLGIFVTTAIFLECDPNDPALPRREVLATGTPCETGRLEK